MEETANRAVDCIVGLELNGKGNRTSPSCTLRRLETETTGTGTVADEKKKGLGLTQADSHQGMEGPYSPWPSEGTCVNTGNSWTIPSFPYKVKGSSRKLQEAEHGEEYVVDSSTDRS